MQPRTEPRTDIKPGWPFVEARRDGASYALCIRGGPRQRSELLAWFGEARKRPLDEAVEASKRIDVLHARAGTDAAEPGDVDEARDLARAAQDAIERTAVAAEGTAGFLILWAWHDATTDLQARLDYDAHLFAGPDDARLRAGLACVDELYAAGWSWEQIDDLASGIRGLLTKGQVDRKAMVEVVPFGEGRT